MFPRKTKILNFVGFPKNANFRLLRVSKPPKKINNNETFANKKKSKAVFPFPNDFVLKMVSNKNVIISKYNYTLWAKRKIS